MSNKHTVFHEVDADFYIYITLVTCKGCLNVYLTPSSANFRLARQLNFRGHCLIYSPLFNH